MNNSIKDSLEKVPPLERHQLTSYIEELEQRVEQQELLLKEAKKRPASLLDIAQKETTFSIRHLLFSLPGAVCLFDFEERRLLATDTIFYSMFDCPQEEVDTTLFLRIFPDQQPDGTVTEQELTRTRLRAVESGNAQRIRLFFRKFNAILFPGEVTILPNPERRSSVYLIFRDHTQSFVQRNALKESERRYREFIELAPVGICKVDVFGKIVLNSAMADSMLGYERRENEGNSIISLLHPDDQGLYVEKIMEMLSGQAEVIFSQVRVRRKDGEYMWLRGGGKLHLDEAGEPTYILITFMDISEIKAAEALLREREAIYQAVVHNATEGIDIVDISDYDPEHNPYGKIILRNKQMNRLFPTEEELLIKHDSILHLLSEYQPNGERSIDVFQRMIQQIQQTGKSKEVIRLQHAADLFFDVEATEQRLRVSGKTLLVRNYHDITEKLRQEELIQAQLQQLNEQNQKLQTYIESNMQLENFAYIASHDLRAPIRTMVSFANLLETELGSRLQNPEREYLLFIRQSATNMQMLIEDLLKFSRANTLKRNLQAVSLRELRSELQINFYTQLEDVGGSLDWENIDQTITADRIKLKQLLQNLISNALKFTSPGQAPVVSVSVSEEAHQWRFAVQDNGIGISEEFKDSIFLIFKRLHNQQQYEGTGIGLALCKKLVEQHDGKIWVESTVGEGSTFYFTIGKNLVD